MGYRKFHTDDILKVSDDYGIIKSLDVSKHLLDTATPEYHKPTSLNPIRLGSGLQNCVREQLARENRVSFSLLMDISLRENFYQNSGTFDDFKAITGLSDHTLRQALNDPLVKQRTLKSGKRGRPTILYTLPDRDTVRKHVTPGQDGMSDHLPQWGLTSVTNYKMARYKMLIARGCKYVASAYVTYSRKFLCEVIGVSKATLRNYEKALEMHVIHNIQETPITAYNANELAGNKESKRAQGAWLTIIKGDVRDKVPAIRSLAHKALAIGAKVMLYQYLPNSYSIVKWQT